MKIDRTPVTTPVRSTPDATARPASRQQPVSAPASAPAVPRQDSVEISTEARALADRHEVPDLSAERIAEIRARIAGNHYGSAVVLEAVAQRLLASGDL
jgi:anti-sigma28 factor (negative regulator of flagellin synthesis)